MSLSKSKQLKALDIADRIAAGPEKISDVTLHDDNGRPIESVLIEEFLFSYWIDHPVKEVRITEITRV